MKKQVPLFPLDLVVFPDEILNLHVFEPRYRQLAKDTLATEEKQFGIPSYVHQTMEYGTIVEIMSVNKLYDDGRMDISTRGLSVFRVADFKKFTSDTLYAVGDLELRSYFKSVRPETLLEFKTLLVEMFHLMGQVQQINMQRIDNFAPYVHKIGLTSDEEYELLQIEYAQKQYEYLVTHMRNMIPTMRRTEEARKKILENGHFKNLDPLNL